MAFTFSSTGGSSGETSINVSATTNIQTSSIVEYYTLSNTSGHSVSMALTQKAAQPVAKYISIKPSSFEVMPKPTNSSIQISSNDNWHIVSSDWIKLSNQFDKGGASVKSRATVIDIYEPEERPNHLYGSGNTIVGISFAENSGDTRHGFISGYCMSDTAVTAYTSVVQIGAAANPYINVSPEIVTDLPSSGISSSITVTSNIAWTAYTKDKWVHITSAYESSGNGTVNYTVDENTDGYSRSGGIKVVNEKLNIVAYFNLKQLPNEKDYIFLEPDVFNVDASGSTGNVITVRANCDYDIDSDSIWITVDSASGSGDGSVTFSTSSNAKVTSDVGNIMFSNSAVSRTVTVSRKSVKTYLSASTSSITTNVNSAESITVEVYSNVKWEAECLDEEGNRIKPDWFYVEPDYGSNNGSIKINFKFGNRSRYGYVRIYNKEFNLTWNIYLKQLNTTRLFYTTTDGEILQLATDQIGNVQIINHNYQNGVGMIEFGGDLRTINSGVCSGQTRLMTLEFPDALKIISENAFYGCTGLTGELVFPESMQYEAGLGGGVIGIRAFYGKSSISKIVIKGNTQMIGYEAFNGPLNNTNRDLNSIYCYSTTPPNQYTDRMYIIPSGLGGELHCPVGTYDTYYNALHSEVEFRDWTFIDDL